MPRLYFAHPVNTYDTELEEDLIEAIAHAFPGWEIENPNQQKHQDGYREYREEVGNGMAYFMEKVLPSCACTVILAFRDGMWGAGVAKEGSFYLERGLPVWEIIPRGDIQKLEEFHEGSILTVDETRRRIRDEKGHPIPY